MEIKSDKIQFTEKCKAYNSGTRFLRILVIYGLPLYIFLSLLTIVLYVAGFRNPPYENFLMCLFEAGKAVFMYFSRKEIFKLTKKGYYFLIIDIILIFITSLITERFQISGLVFLLFGLVFFYIYKRVFLFEENRD